MTVSFCSRPYPVPRQEPIPYDKNKVSRSALTSHVYSLPIIPFTSKIWLLKSCVLATHYSLDENNGGSEKFLGISYTSLFLYPQLNVPGSLNQCVIVVSTIHLYPKLQNRRNIKLIQDIYLIPNKQKMRSVPIHPFTRKAIFSDIV